MRTTILLAALMSFLVYGCDSGQYDQSMQPPGSGVVAPGAPTRDGGAEKADQVGAMPASNAPSPEQRQPGTPLGIPSAGGDSSNVGIERQIIRSGDVGLTVEHLDSAERTLRRIVAANGGYTAGSSRQRLEGSALTSTIEVRVPSKTFDALLDAVRLLGETQFENITASDVTEEYIDLEARLKGQQQLEARILKLLEERPGKLSDVVEIEQKLADVRSVIESIQGRLRYLSSRVGFSTLTVRMTEPGTIIPGDTDTFGGRLERAFVQGIDSLTRLIAGLLTLIIGALPIIVLGVIVWVVVRKRVRTRRADAATTSAPKEKEADKT